MKKFFVVLLGIFVFFFSNTSVADTSTITKKLEAKVLVEQEVLEEEPEETDDSIIETSIPNEYVEEVSYVEETHSINYGTYGRLYVSWHDVALYDYNVYTNSDLSLQGIVDNYDSAAYYASHSRLVIADHNTQGFNVLYNLSEGTTAYIKFGDGSTIGYRLILNQFGYNTGPDLVDTAGNSFFDMNSDLIMYTCYGDGIIVTLWVLI